MPPNFFNFMTPVCDSSSGLIFATHFCDSRSRLAFVTPFHDSNLRPPFATHCFATNLSCDSTTERRTVFTPQRHLPRIQTLTLIKTNNSILRNHPHCLASPSSCYPPPCPPPLVDLCLLTLPLAHPLL